MRIVQQELSRGFGELKAGDVFKMGGTVYMKIVTHEMANAVVLITGIVAVIPGDSFVKKLECELVYE